jgi:hypothetical protein
VELWCWPVAATKRTENYRLAGTDFYVIAMLFEVFRED